MLAYSYLRLLRLFLNTGGGRVTARRRKSMHNKLYIQFLGIVSERIKVFQTKENGLRGGGATRAQKYLYGSATDSARIGTPKSKGLVYIEYP